MKTISLAEHKEIVREKDRLIKYWKDSWQQERNQWLRIMFEEKQQRKKGRFIEATNNLKEVL